MILSNGVTVKYIKTSIDEILKFSDEDTFIVTEGSIFNSLEESVSIVGDIFDKNYRELFSKNTKLTSYFEVSLSGLLISNDKVKD